MTIQQSRPIDYTNQDSDIHAEDICPVALLRFSIILCTYNRRNMVLSTLASLRRQTLSYTLFEVIVVDNGSSDSTLQAVRSYVNAGAAQRRQPEDTWQVQCLTEPHNGLAHARNKGLQAAKGEIAVFLDDDTLLEPSFLAQLLDTYETTGADAVGGRVELQWDAPRPHWLYDDLLEMLGRFAPFYIRIPLPETLNFSSCNFSVKTAVLRTIGSFSPFLSKRLHVPTQAECADLCHRLRSYGYSLWYEPDAVILHRVPAARIQRAFFQGRAYWRGRSIAMLHYVNTPQSRSGIHMMTFPVLWALLREFYEILELALLHRPLLFLSSQPPQEQLRAALTQAEIWGHLCQQLQFIEHAPALLNTPSVLFVRPRNKDIFLLEQGLLQHGTRCAVSNASIPLAWLWRHRTYRAQPIGIIHLYQAGAFHLNFWQRQRFWFLLRLAQHLGIRIITTDTGGWWHNVRSLRFLLHRTFERRLFYCSDIVLTHARQIAHLYPDSKLRDRVHFLIHPGYRGYSPPAIAREQAHQELGVPSKASYVYLCLAYLHSEYELVHLIDAFTDAKEQQQRKKETSSRKRLQLLLVGSPKDRKIAHHILERAAMDSAIHLFLEFTEQDLPLFMGASDAVVFPHFAIPAVGMLEMVLLSLSYERIVVVPDLPRFQGVLPPHASIFYNPDSRAGLVQALVKAQSPRSHLREKDLRALDVSPGWQHHSERLLDIYRMLLSQQ
ncbi:MAG: glycosyltransferase [Ktedonobacteraceae bacterium]|nr:glycosyltransferase [Ktedonobacteraceae bacterium]